MHALTGSYPLELFGVHVRAEIDLGAEPWSLLKTETVREPYKHVVCLHRQSCISLFKNTGYGPHCTKIRKAAPNHLIGNCIVRKTKQKGEVEDWIVCPERFVEEQKIFKDCLRFLDGNHFSVVKEVKIGSDGNLDYAVISRDEDGSVRDFVGIEVQACGTGGTGPIWTARNDFLKGRLKKNYNFSLNQKDASKKILVQLLHKARQIGRWRKNTVLVIQNHFLNHLRQAYAIDSHFHPQDLDDPVHIHSYKTVDHGDKITIELEEAISADMIGLSMVLISNPATTKAKRSDFERYVTDRFSTGDHMELPAATEEL